MTSNWRCWYWKLGLASWLAMGGAIAVFGDCAIAQIKPDGTLPNNSIVTPQGNTSVIEGGTQAGSNLFHSFEKFSVPTGGGAYFNNALDIQNIISRVTGGSISNIDGLLRANGTANLFLLNPNGIIFGPNATLAIGGSILASTASSLNFADGTQFSATAHPTTPLLTVSVPLGLQFGGNAGGIQVQQSILQVQTGQTLALIGGDVSVEGGEFGFLSAQGGRIELGGLAGAGMVEIEGQQSEVAFGLTQLRFPDAVLRADVLLTNSATVNVAASGGGSIAINARNIDISGSSVLRGGLETDSGFLGATAGDMTLNATGAIALANSDIFNNVRTGAVGKGGDIYITTGSLSVTNGAQLAASTFGQGDAGSVKINARDTVFFDGVGSDGFSGAFSTVGSGAVGNGGDINITTGLLSVTNGAQLDPSTYGRGDAGNIQVSATEFVTLSGTTPNGQYGSALSTKTRGTGAAGDLTIITGKLTVQDGAFISANTYGSGQGGTLTVRASDAIELSGTAPNGQYASALSTDTRGTGAAGDLTITTGQLTVQDGAFISSDTYGSGQGGTLTVRASDAIELSGTTPNGQYGSALSTDTRGAGAAGDLTITTGQLTVRDRAFISADTYGSGQGGTLTVRASDAIELSGTTPDGEFSSALSTYTRGTGAAGDLTITTGQLTVRDGAFISTDTNGAGAAGDLTITTGQLTVRDGATVTVGSKGSGNAGNLEVMADSIRLDNQADLIANTTAGQGNIILRSGDLVLRRGSNITTNARGTATGGNITIDTGVIAALENSDISANAQEARGGRVIINAQGIFGTEFRNQQTPESDITASSNLGPEFSGTVEINTPDVDPSQGLATLPAELVDASGLIAQGCGSGGRQGKSKFIITGRGELPIRPTDAHISHYPTGTVRSIPSSSPSSETPRSSVSGSDSSTNPTSSEPPPLVEAQGWVINDEGEVVLTATAPNVTPNIPWVNPATCHGSATFHEQPLASHRLEL